MLTQEEIDKPLSVREIEFIVNNYPTKLWAQMASLENSNKYLRKKEYDSTLTLLENNRGGSTCQMLQVKKTGSLPSWT